MPDFSGSVYQSPSGQWAWSVSKNGVPVSGGSGYLSEDEANEAMTLEIEAQRRS